MQTPWKVDEVHSSIQFSVRHMVVAKLSGRFRRWTACLAMDDANLAASSVEIAIDVDSIDSGNAERDASLRSPRFFDAGQFPSMTFRSTRVEHAAGDTYRIVGDLTLRGVTKEVVLETELGGYVTDARGARRAGFSARGCIQRSDFGMVFNQVLETGGVAIGERVEILVDVEAVADEQLAKARAQVAEMKKMFEETADARARRQKEKPLYERLGGRGALHAVVTDIIELHFAEPITKPLTKGVDQNKLVALVVDFLCQASGGPEKYTGRDMVSAHAHLGMTDIHFVAAGDQIMRVLAKYGVPEPEQQEVMCAIIAHHDDVIRG